MGRVLVVEDDAEVCGLIAEALRDVGLDALCVGTDTAAYRWLPTDPAFEALVVDINLGQGTTGFDVARFARRVLPRLPVVYVTGQASEESVRMFGVPGSTLISKPFIARDLQQALASGTRPAA